MLITYLIDGKIIYKQLLAEGRLQLKFFFEIHLRKEKKIKMIAILLFVVAVVNGQNYGYQQSRDNQQDSHWISRLTGHRSDDNRCPSLTGANNNDFNNVNNVVFDHLLN